MSRWVTVATVNRGVGPDEAADLDLLIQTAEQHVLRGVRQGADIVAFPEIYAHLGKPFEQLAEIAEPLDGPSTTRMAEVAARHGCYLIWCLWEREGEYLYNTAALLDRQGELVGRYRKMFPTTGEIEGGVLPGTEASVFETDFGHLGLGICFDMNFDPLWDQLHAGGAEILFFCSMYRAHLQMQARALEHGSYFVSAITGEAGQIVDQTGKVLSVSYHNTVLVGRLNLNRRLLHVDFNHDKLDALLEKYGADLTFDYAGPEGRFALGCLRPGLSVEQIIDEFGLERLEDYWPRALHTREDALHRAGRM